MYKFISNMLFLMMSLLGLVMTLSSMSWFTSWVGLEISLLSFIPLMSPNNSNYSTEASLKYFLIQSIGSVFILLSSVLFLYFKNIPMLLLLFNLTMKCGAAPLHLWFPPVVEGLEWPQIFMLLTMQKLGPLSLMCWIKGYTTLMMMVAMISAMVGAIGGLGELKLKKLLAFSSINHLCWPISSIMFSKTWWFLYFVLYSVVLSLLVYSMAIYKIMHFNQLKFLNAENLMIVSSTLVSIGGLPPMLGFFPKLMIINLLIGNQMFILVLVFIMTSSISLFYYMRILISLFISMNSNKSLKFKNLLTPQILLNLSSIMLIPLSMF